MAIPSPLKVDSIMKTDYVLDTDILHSGQEERYILLGKTKQQRLLFIVFTLRDAKIRVISARGTNDLLPARGGAGFPVLPKESVSSMAVHPRARRRGVFTAHRNKKESKIYYG